MAAVILCLVAGVAVSAAQYTVRGRVLSRLDSRDVVGATVTLLDADRNVVASTKARNVQLNYLEKENIYVRDSTATYRLSIPRREGDYTLTVTHGGYDTLRYALPLRNLPKREIEREMPNLFLTPARNAKDLDEVVVEASKVKFYWKNDTIVYDASAFMLPEGSMLDALVAQLPGVEVKENGKIYVNGRYVESLLLNGKDFFKKNQNVMLQNLGAYMVRNIKVYEKQSDFAMLLGKDLEEEKQFVMDVSLKKDYMTGGALNAEAAGGTERLWLGQLFGLLFTNNWRWSAYFNGNNLGNTNRPSQGNAYISVMQNLPGRNKIVNGGADYMYQNTKRTFEANGNADVKSLCSDVTTTRNAVNFLPGGDTWSASYAQNRTNDFSVSTTHTLKFQHRKNRWEATPSYAFNRAKTDNDETEATFREEYGDMTLEILKHLYTGNGHALREAVINRNKLTAENTTRTNSGALSAKGEIKMPYSSDYLRTRLDLKHTRRSADGTVLQGVDYGPLPESTLMRRDTRNRPDNNLDLTAGGTYYLNIPKVLLYLGYGYNFNRTHMNSELLMMSAMATGEEAVFLPGQMPELDAANSYTSKLHSHSHTVEGGLEYSRKSSKLKFSMGVYPKFKILTRRLDYLRGGHLYTPHGTEVGLDRSSVKLNFDAPKGGKYRISLQYSAENRQAPLLSKVGIIDDTNPLVVQAGNPDLRQSFRHGPLLYTSFQLHKNNLFRVNGSASFVSNDIVKGYRYDTATGRKIMKDYNVNGNMNGMLYIADHQSFGRNNAFGLNTTLTLYHYRYANMVGADAEPVRQRVRQSEIQPGVNMSYQKRGLIWCSAGIEGTVSRSRSDDPGFRGYTTQLVIPRGQVTLYLPRDFSIETSCMGFIYRGMMENNLNRSFTMWNAKVTKTFDKGRWRLSLEAHDILNDQPNTRSATTATQRTETSQNMLPRYLMLTVGYRFQIDPKRK